ncbi:MAG: cupin domain-containing protein [Acidobacteriaceae bacterium]
MPIPPDDPTRHLVHAQPNTDESLPHIGLVGNTYTVLLNSNDTAGRFCLIDMLILPNGGPPLHRHDFEETFIVLEGQIEATFRGDSLTVGVGETIHIPANAPHQFQNATTALARLLCICSPAGQEEYFAQIGVSVPTRTTPPPPLDEAAQAAFGQKVASLAARYRTEMVPKP